MATPPKRLLPVNPPTMMRAAALAAAFVALGGLTAAAQQPGLPLLQPPLLQPPLRHTTPDGYRAHLDSLRATVAACRDNASACDPAAVGEDDFVEAPDPFQSRWQWLRKLLGEARSPALPDRAALLDQASARLEDERSAGEASTQVPAAQPHGGFPAARRAANSILAAPEFRIVARESWFDRKTAEFWAWFNRLFVATADLGRRAPWLAKALEGSFVGLALLGLLLWVRRTLARQSFALALDRYSAPAPGQKESGEWAARAEAEAAQAHWREAIHCVYWAAILALERRRRWSRNLARTPREYLPLLEASSPQQIALGALTGIFERIWYGLRGAAREDYAQALALFEELRQA